MDIAQAKTLIHALSQGIDPVSGEMLHQDSCFNQPAVIRALYAAHSALEKSLAYEKRKRALPENAGKAWDLSEDEQLIRLFDEGTSLAELAKQHHRTSGSIKARLEKLGKISPV
ncbi:hypothetical protein [Alteromonas lipolytica]|uniref:Uncharacterized protein n=1 Tax=Alteromonas lipolytica TaxID=1856405 RepID=A0A1E8FHB3_9ALTE|nr:hypothetical protein [Alteromonas lipolytica]OFI35332.1 hypothetical protein BFC17_13690 [Alteromonas lipolytica]